ncbi:MAG: hypothetical protein RL113_189 [Pseudomonadota bacterium]|jgi:hypothetical protein
MFISHISDNVFVNNISRETRLKVLIRLLKNNELFDIACSKSGLEFNDAKKLLAKNTVIKH